MSRQYSVIIVAGGKGSRFGSSTPKQFLPLGNATVLETTVGQFKNSFPELQVIVVLPENHLERGKNLLGNSFSDVEFEAGGKERFHSVKNGLQRVNKQAEVIGIHDAVRPLVSPSVIENAYLSARKYGTGVPVVPVSSSMRKLRGKQSVIVNRDEFVTVQTPQCFQASILQKSYKVKYREEFTDDASVVEYAGYKINLVTGNQENIKITTPPDLDVAEFMLNRMQNH